MKREAQLDVRQAIEITALCQAFNCLPRPGGLYDQDPKDIYMMREVLLAEQEKADADAERKRK